ncbi:MAG: hypothetical protein MR493_05290 [Aerococcus suis]|nr:hypothetical protein [Aerococcus suis]MDD7758521.1 phenylalanine--tRNA ligase beta subunit-related protein [Aerococcus suis]MDY4646192.1 phenylalanine--tRNA ligase beta subunit-related protein [Aerococcus suis]
MQFKVTEEFWQLFPEAEIFLLTIDGLDNSPVEEWQDKADKMLKSAARDGLEFVPNEPISKNPVVEQWREAFRQFKTKKGARSSIEALLKRVQKGSPVNSINPLVDLYNMVSMRHAVPVGSEDLAKVSGDIRLDVAEGGESFLPLGAEEDSPSLPGEVGYFDNDGAICRCFNWREAQRTMITEETETAVIVIEAINDEQKERAQEAQNELADLLAEHLDVTASKHHLTVENPYVDLNNEA